MFLLDTDHIGIIQARAEPEFNRLSIRMSRYSPGDFSFSVISLQENFLGWNAYISRARTTAELTRGYAMFLQVLTDYNSVRVLPFDDAAAAIYEALQEQRLRVATMDLRIAAVALSRDATLLSRNLRDFRKVPGLKVEDWTT